jgi:hypothetical protein
VDVIAELVRGVTADAARIGLSTVSNSGSAATLPTEDGGCNDSVAGAAVSSGIGAGGMLSVTDAVVVVVVVAIPMGSSPVGSKAVTAAEKGTLFPPQPK